MVLLRVFISIFDNFITGFFRLKLDCVHCAFG